MTTFSELIRRNQDASVCEERPLRQAVLFALFYIFCRSDRLTRQWRKALDFWAVWLRNLWFHHSATDQTGSKALWWPASFTLRSHPAFMYLTKYRPVLTCWPKQIQRVWLLPIVTLFQVVVTILGFAHSLLPSCLHRFIGESLQKSAQVIMDATGGITLRQVKHVFSVMALLGLIFLAGLARGGIFGSEFSAFERYGVFLSVMLYMLQSTVLVPLPFFVFNFLGVVLLNVFTTRPKLRRSPLLGPFLCFRVVTRGLYPDLVNTNVRHNLDVCANVGLQNYIFQVVTDIPINLEKNNRSRELVVPKKYKTPTGSLFKARALQYALEPEVDILGEGHWIVHLDEETILTEEAVIGIINFAGSAEYSFGQGVIKYGKGKIINWITTLADSIRVGIDYGCIRFSLGVLHKPVFSWKGSFIVADAEAEKKITFDHGPEGSIAEDCYFACVAFSKGYSFGFVEGEMLEKSTFTLNDFIQQRRRWMHGILLTALSKKIPLRYRLGPVLMSFSGCTMPANLLMFPLSMIFPMPSSPLIALSYSFILGTILYLFILGTAQTFCIKQYGYLRYCLLVCATILCGLVACILENISSLLVFWLPKTSINSFYVVNKEVQSDCLKIM